MNRYFSSPLSWLTVSALLLLIYVLVFTPNVPIGDQWDVVPLLQHQSWSNALTQLNDHRTVIPNVIVLALARATGWELKGESVASLFFLVALIFLIYFTFAGLVRDRLASLLFGLVMLTQMTPIHHENILYVFSALLFSSFFVFLALATAALLRNIVLSVALLLVASFSFLSGWLGWFAVAFFAWRLKRFPGWFSLAFVLPLA